MTRLIATTALIVALAIGEPAMAQSTSPTKCDVPIDMMHVDDRLPLVGAHVRASKPVRIVAIGGDSTAGSAAGDRDLAYPQRLQMTLAQRWLKVVIEVVNRGVARDTALEMIQRFERDVFAEKPTLVIWEVGINDAVRGVDINEFSRNLQAGIDLLRAKHIDVLIMDMQYSRRSASIIGFDPYLRALHRIADINNVIWFPRYEIMKYWSESGVFNFSNVRPEERRLLAAKVYDCLARLLADMIQKAMQ